MRRIPGRRVCALSVVLIPLLSPQARAQTLPPSADPGRVDERLATPPRPQSLPPLELQSEEFAPPPAQAGLIKFDLARVAFQGARPDLLPALDALAAPLLGREVSLLEVYQLRDAVTARYRNDGFTLSQAVVPAQRIEDGVVRLDLVEGYVSALEVQGDVPGAEALVAAHMAGVLAERPLRLATLERALLVLNDRPGIVATSVFRPAEDGEAGASVLTVVLRRTLWSGSVAIDNRGSKAIGPWQADTSASVNGPAQQVSVRALVARPTSELRLGDLGYTHWIGTAGTTLTAGVRRSLSQPGGRTKALDLDSLTDSVRVGFGHPILRGRSESLRLSGEASLRDSRTDVFSGQPNQQRQSEDRLRTAALTASWDFADVWAGSNLVQGTLTRGFAGLGASPAGEALRSRRDGRPDFWKLALTLQRDQPLGDGWAATVSADGQWSDVPLFSSEEYGVGGKTYGRAFDPSTVTGDRGGAVRLELLRSLLSEGPGDLSLAGFGFGDLGAVWNFGATPRAGWQAIGSAGGGLRASLGAALSGSVTAAKPLSDGADTGRDWRYFFTLTARF